jgi:hypothetical protein
MNYDPHSPDSMFTRIMEKLEDIDARTTRIETQVNLTNGRVGHLERWREMARAHIKAISAITSMVIGALIWAVEKVFF